MTDFSLSGTCDVESVSISGENRCTEGEQLQLTATVLPEDASDKSVSWESGNTDIATVDEDGLVSALSEGTVFITVTTNDGGLQNNIELTVTSSYVAVESVSISGSVGCYIGNSRQLAANIYPTDATDQSVVWESSNTNIAEVSDTGLVTGISEGTITINVTTNDGGYTSSLSFEVSIDISADNSKIADHSIMGMLYHEEIPDNAIVNAVNNLHIAYGHTSHGSQIVDGMTNLPSFANSNLNSYSNDIFQWNVTGDDGALHLHDHAFYSDWGDLGRDDWQDLTRDYLGSPTSEGKGSLNSDINVVMWSWCGQLSYYSTDMIQTLYLNEMQSLEEEYFGISFIYMTGHNEEPPSNATVLTNNNYIRDFCDAYDKWLYDFADIEKYNLDGEYFGDRLVDDSCYYDSDNDGILEMPAEGVDPEPEHDSNWAVEWQDSHTLDEEWYNCNSAHSQPVNANQKAYAAWWLFARIAGWDGE